jgi:hypothetical protein
MTIRSCIFAAAVVGLMPGLTLATMPLIHKISETLPETDNYAPFRCVEDDQGGFYVVWVDVRSPHSVLLRAQHFGSEGRPGWDEAGLTVTDRLSSIDDWHAMSDGQGGLTLLWNAADGVRVQRFRPEGTRRFEGHSLLVSSFTATKPDAVPDAVGGTLLVWSEIAEVGRPVLRAQRIDSEGTAVWTEGGLRVSWRASYQTNPKLIYDSMSGMIVAWRDEAQSSSELRVQRIDFGGNLLWGQEGLKIMAPMGVAEYPRLAPLKPGEAVLAWSDTVSQRNQIFLQKVGPDATLAWDPPILASPNKLLFSRWNPVLRGDFEGGTWIAWEDYRSQTNYLLQLNRLDGAGMPRWPRGEIAAAAASGDQGKAAMITDADEGIWLAWIDNRNTTTGLYVQQVDAQGNLLLERSGALVASGLRKPSPPQLASLGSGQAVVCWTDRLQKGRSSLSWAVLGSNRSKP